MFFVCFLLSCFGCYAADSSFSERFFDSDQRIIAAEEQEALVNKLASQWIEKGAMVNDSIEPMFIKDNEKVQLYLKVGRKIIQDLFEKDPIVRPGNLQQYEYSIAALAEKNLRNSKVKRAKVQLSESGDPFFFWH